MKPDRSGTWTEQVMFRAGWASKSPLPGTACKGCFHLKWGAFKKPRCMKHGFLTQVSATCPSFTYKDTDLSKEE